MQSQLSNFLLYCLGVVIFMELANAKILQEQYTARKLRKSPMSRSDIGNWMCAIKAESQFNTRLRTGPAGVPPSYKYGIFQINSTEWCTMGGRGGRCNENCLNFMDDDITDDIVCAKKIHYIYGFNYWPGWVAKCKGKIVRSYLEYLTGQYF